MNVNLSQGLVVGPEASKFSIPDGPFPVWLKVVGSDTGGALFAQTGIMTPGILNPPHTHSREDEITYVVEGELSVEIGDEVSQAPAGSVIWRPRGIRHAAWNGGDRPVRYFEVITPAGFEHWFEELGRLFATGGMSLETVLGLAPRYGIEFDMAHAAELMARFNLRPPV